MVGEYFRLLPTVCNAPGDILPLISGLPDSYPINAIKSSYIPVIESICRSALFGSQQFRRILQMKHSNHTDIHLVRKRHSEGSLSIASALSGSALFRPRLSEPRLPVYMMNSDDDALRCNSASPILRLVQIFNPQTLVNNVVFK